MHTSHKQEKEFKIEVFKYVLANLLKELLQGILLIEFFSFQIYLKAVFELNC